MKRSSENVSPAWEAAISSWERDLLAEGKTKKTANLRRVHVRSIAQLSRTAHPSQLTADAVVTICKQQGYARGYRCDLRTSLVLFYDWAVGAGLAPSNPITNLLGDLITPLTSPAVVQTP